jgi:hypothetical protein
MHNNLKIFKGTEYNLNAVQNGDGVWEASIFLDEVSTGLYESVNIFIMEEVELNGDVYLNKPIAISTGASKFEYKWSENIYESEDINLYGASLQGGVLKITDGEKEAPILDSTTSIGQNADGLNQVTEVDNEAIQINVALSSKEEGRHQRTLLVYENNGSTRTLIAKIFIYGEVVGEDERLKILLQNFGATLDDGDFILFKEHDITEMAPDQILLNQKRRELLLELSNIKPFIGTYKAVLNAIDFFGYNNLTLKEYWLNINTGSNSFGKLKAIPVANSSKYGEAIRKKLDIELPSSNLKKTSRFSLVYKINVPNGEVDEWDIPKVDEVFDFTPEEVLIKLYGLKRKLHKEYLPLNAKIVDITGEADFFAQKNQNIWNNQNPITFVTEGIDIKYEHFPIERTLFVEDVALILKKVYDPSDTVGTGYADTQAILNTAFEDYDTLSSQQLSDLREAFTLFYQTYYDQPLDTFNYSISNSTQVPVGCPVILDGQKTFDYTWDSAQFNWNDSIDPQVTWDNWWKRWVYEIEWIVTGPNGWEHSFRGPIDDYLRFPLFLPYEGAYSVEMRTYDLFGHRSYDFKKDMLDVYLKEVELYAFYKRRGKNTWNDKKEVKFDQAGGYWDAPYQNQNILDEINASWYLGLDRANYIHDTTSPEDINFSTVSRYEDIFSEDGFSETAGPYSWDNSDFDWKWTEDLWWDATRVGSDTTSSFIIQTIQNGSVLEITHTNPSTNEVETGSVEVTVATPATNVDIAGWQALADELNASTDPIISKFNFNPVFEDINGTETFIYILVVGKGYSRTFDYDSVTLTNGTTDGEYHGKAYNPTFDDTEIYSDWRSVNRSTHVTFCPEFSKMPGMKLNKWTITNNTAPDKSDIYYGDIVLTYLFRHPGEYTISLEVEDSNGNTNSIHRNMLKVN